MPQCKEIIVPGEWRKAKWSWFWNKDRSFKTHLLFRWLSVNENVCLAYYSIEIKTNEQKMKLKTIVEQGQVEVFVPTRTGNDILENVKSKF